MNTVQNEISRLGFSQGQLVNSCIVASEEDVSEYAKSLEEFQQDAIWLFKNAGVMLTTG